MRSEKGGIHIIWFKCASEYIKIKNNVSNAEKEYIFNIIYILLTNYILILEIVFFFFVRSDIKCIMLMDRLVFSSVVLSFHD